MQIKVIPLGAGQDVGRSCILLTIGGKNIMFDCGMHMGYNDDRRFPDFNYITRENKFTELIDCLIISHFHLDHCGALPYFTEMLGYHGPVYMTYPTKAICPILLEDYRKITVERKGETNFFTSEMIKNCMKRVIAVNIHQTVKVDDELEIKAYYAGHVLGAAMFHVRVGGESAVYTGDYNMTPDRHLGSAWIDRVRPDVLITETTYATTIRDSKRARERDFLKKVHDCVAKGGKVLIPVFALGRAQELCILIDSYWERMNLKVPIYFAAGMTEKANDYYRLFINWTNQKIKKTFVKRNMFDFKNIKTFNRAYADDAGPMVLFASPGMLHAGTSLEVFKKWAPNEKNMVIMPGYCVAGTVGAKVLAGQKQIELDKKTVIEVKLQIQHLSFSAHADAKGIMQLIRQAAPRNVVLVHGEKAKMGFLKQKIWKEFEIPCFDPANGTTVSLNTSQDLPVDLSTNLLKRALEPETDGDESNPIAKRPKNKVPLQGFLVMKDNEPLKMVDSSEISTSINKAPHQLTFSMEKQVNLSLVPALFDKLTKTQNQEQQQSSSSSSSSSSSESLEGIVMEFLLEELRKWLGSVVSVQHKGTSAITLRSIEVRLPESPLVLPTCPFTVSWSYLDEDLAMRVMSIIDSSFNLEPSSLSSS